MQDRLEDWLQWKQFCTLEKCDLEVRKNLAAYGRKCFVDFTTKMSGGAVLPELPDRAGTSQEDGETCWMYVEHRLVDKNHSSGKSYKRYIFDHVKAQEPQNQLRSTRRGFRDQVRNVVKDYLALEISEFNREKAHKWIRLNDAVGLDETTEIESKFLSEDVVGSHSLLFGLSECEIQDFKAIAAELAPVIWERTNFRCRAMLVAAVLGLSLADPRLLQAADCGKSQLYATRTAFNLLVSDRLKEVEIEGDALAVQVLKMLIAEQLENELISWGKLEKSLQPLFMDIKEGAL